MLSWLRPAQTDLEKFLREQAGATFSYAPQGVTNGPAPPGFLSQHTQAELGTGAEIFSRARAAFRQWIPFQLGWVFPGDPTAPLVVGTDQAVVARVGGLWWKNAARIVAAWDEPQRFGFAYGTLTGHVAAGEEWFQLELDAEERVRYEIRAYSQLRHWLPRLCAPWSRAVQKRFAVDSVRALRHALGIVDLPPPRIEQVLVPGGARCLPTRGNL